MPNPKHYNMYFGPKSYWGPKTLKRHVGSTIKGQLRKEAVVNNIEREPVPDELVLSSLKDPIISNQRNA